MTPRSAATSHPVDATTAAPSTLTAPIREGATLSTAPPMRLRTHVRATVVILLVGVLALGVAYPVVMTGLAQVLNPSGANGSLVYQNGTLRGSLLVAENTSLPYLFWERVSLTDYNTTLGYEQPPGPTDPALGAWLNETILYLQLNWNLSANSTLPLDLVAPSYSGTDPFLVPAGVLIQIPRVAEAIVTNFTHASFASEVANLTSLVNQYVQNPFLGIVGTPVVNVLSLDIALLNSLGSTEG
ncbi:MAG: potassium-transporting ATPase subunit C [Thermoplasmata archaeon]